MYQWISWVQPTNDYRPLSCPPNDAVLGWWCSGYAEDGATLCAMVRAETVRAARAAIREDWPEAIKWRFCEPHKSIRERKEGGYTGLGGRFIPDSDWSRQRFADAAREAA